jgi:type I restriction enzyme S subunit
VKVSKDKALPDYVAFFLNSPLGRQQINALSRHIIGQANINSEELKGIQICVPPLEVQCKIVDMVNRQRQRIAEERKTAEERQAQAARELEEMIFGIRPVK